MKARIKVLTPVHIGSGQVISPSGYFIDKERGKFNVLNMDSLFRDKDFAKYRDDFIKQAASSRYIGDIIQDHNLLKRHVLYSTDITTEARGHKIEVKAFVKSAGRPYFPGSSIKGSVITALIYFALKELATKGKKKEIEALMANINDRKANDRLLDLAYGYLSGKNVLKKFEHFSDQESDKSKEKFEDKFLNLLDVSDSTYLSPRETLRVEKCLVQGARRGGNIPVLYETIKENVEAEFEIKKKKCQLEEGQILKICDNFYRKVIKNDGLNLNLPEKPGYYLLRVGQGATAFSTSMLILADEVGIKSYKVKRPRTRKRLIDGELKKGLGFVEVSLG
ncbi:MAG: type III-A CRISPR-associated RAMP protein Csm5 [Candidatus Aminicenantes bacterium]|nr:type III-A CRISPR-associated RAMP protein Csm5 [Candidatus Aminicenantes bacterium]